MADIYSNGRNNEVFESGCRAESTLGKMWDEVRTLWTNAPHRETRDCNKLNQSALDASDLNDKEKEVLALMYQALVRGDEKDLKAALSSNQFNEESAPRFVEALNDRLSAQDALPQMRGATASLDQSTGQLGLAFEMPVNSGAIPHEKPLVLVASGAESAAFVLTSDRPASSLSYDFEHYYQNHDGRIYADKFAVVDTSDAMKEVANRLNYKGMGELPRRPAKMEPNPSLDAATSVMFTAISVIQNQ